MSRVESSEKSNEHIQEALYVLKQLFELESTEEHPGYKFMQKAHSSIDTLADFGLRATNPILFALSAERLLSLISGGTEPEDSLFHQYAHELSYGANAVLRQKELLTAYIASDQKDSKTRLKQESSILLMNELFINEDEHISKSIKEIYSEIQPQIIRYMLTGKRGFAESERLYLEEYPFACRYFLEKANKVLAEIPLSEFRPRINEILTSDDSNVREAGEILSKSLLAKIGFTEDEISWEIDKFKPDPDNLADSIDTIFALEQKIGGIAKWLFHARGIKHFGRYSPELLLDQLKYANDKTNPWGIIIYPYNDSNDAFYENLQMFDKLNSDLKGSNSEEATYRLRIVEGGNLVSLTKILIRLLNQYGPVSFVWIGGHGDKKSIELSNRKDVMGYLQKGNLTDSGVIRLIGKLCIPNASVLLESCQTGRKGGLAQSLSDLGLEVSAPKNDSNIEKVTLEFFNGRLIINPTFRKASDKNTFKNGKLIKEE